MKPSAIKLVNELARLERKGVRLLRPAMLEIQRLAKKHLDNFDLKVTELDAVFQIIKDIQIETALKSKRRTRIELKTISLSTVEDEMLLQALEAEYSAETLKVIQNLTTRLNAGVRQALKDAVASNVTPRAAIDFFFSKAGLGEGGFHYFENLLRTQTQIVYNSARFKEYESPEIAEIIWGYEYMTVGDDRVRPNHAACDGVILPKEDPFWQTHWPPNGWRCRCQVVPVFDKTRIRRPLSNNLPDPGFSFNPSRLRLDF